MNSPDALLLAALISGRSKPACVSESQWPRIIAEAMRNQLGPLLLQVIRKDIPSLEQDPRSQPLSLAEQQAAVHYALLADTQRRLITAFEEKEIPAIWLKGIALAQTLYPSPHLRPMLDLDLLIPPDCREAALAIAARLGFHLPEVDYLEIVGAPDSVRQHDALIGGPGNRLTLEIHFRLLAFEGDRWLPPEQIEWFWSHTQVQTCGKERFTVLQPEAHLLYLCAHAILQHGEAYLDLLHLYDLHLLALQPGFDWELVVSQAQTLGWSFIVERALKLIGVYFATPVPESALAQLHSIEPVKGDCNAAATRLRSYTGQWEEWKSIFHRLTPGKRILLVWKTFFPPPTLIRDLYKLKPDQPVLPYYFTRWFARSCEITRSIRAGLARHFQHGS